MVATPLAVEVRLKLPHFVLSQVTVQLTPPLLGSLATVAIMLLVPSISREVGNAGLKLTTMLEVTLIWAEANAFGFVTDVAVTVTVFGDGIVEGAV